MPIDVPSEPKVYTTKYANFRGVDYTNDASNVWYRRSPCGLNMLPDLDGKPFKRNGWKVEFTSDDFVAAILASYEDYDSTKTYVLGDKCKYDDKIYRCTADNTTGTWAGADWTQVSFGTISQYKVDYFELGGSDYLFFYTSEGCFYYSSTLTYINASYEIESDGYSIGENVSERPAYYRTTHVYDIGDYCYILVGGAETFYRRKEAMTAPESSFDATKWVEVAENECSKPFPPAGASIDHGKSFFFEGGGRAAYYLFTNGKMYWFGVEDGVETLHEAHPYVPTILTMCDNAGVGTVLEDVNMLTDLRAIEYTCAGGSQTDFTIPGGFVTDNSNPTGIWGVYLKNADGEWVLNTNWSMLVDGESIRFNSAPPETVNAQNNLRIEYKPVSLPIVESLKGTAPDTLTIQRDTRQEFYYWYIDGEWVDNGHSGTSSTYSYIKNPTFVLENPKQPVDNYLDVYVQNYDGTWSVDSTNVTRTYSSYGDKVTIKPLYGLYKYPNIAEELVSQDISYENIHVNGVLTSRTEIRKTRYVKTFHVKVNYMHWEYDPTSAGMNRNAFFASAKSLVYGNGIINQAFLTASASENFNTRVWYSAATNPYYFPDTNYIEVGATDKPIMGLLKVGDYLGVVKKGGNTETSIYLAYATSFEDITTYAVKQSVNGIGAISNGAFNILNDESLFLSEEGVMGIEPAENEERKLRNRSYYINKKLMAETGLENAFSFVYGGMYWLGINEHCYVLDGAQKSSWENTKTNLQYECYYLENIPAKCFAKKDGQLWFINSSEVCRFRDDSDALRFVDDYDCTFTETADGKVVANVLPTDMKYSPTDIYESKTFTTQQAEWTDALRDELYAGTTLDLSDIPDAEMVGSIEYIVTVDGVEYSEHIDFTPAYPNPLTDLEVDITAGQSFFNDIPNVTDSATYQINFAYYKTHESAVNDVIFCVADQSFYTVTEVGDDITVGNGVPVKAVWGTIADDDNSAHYYKKLQKKGSIVALMPMSDSGVKVSIIPDEKTPIYVGETETGSHVLPFNYYLKKKVKKYKRLQIVCENNSYNNGFGIDEIIKCYTLGSYAKR